MFNNNNNKLNKIEFCFTLYIVFITYQMNTLPQTILNLIGEFNADHRDKWSDVLYEFIEKERVCYYCEEYMEEINQRRPLRLLGCRYIFCSILCGIQGEMDIFERYAIKNRQRIIDFNRARQPKLVQLPE